jgi:hypothetical protein
MVADKNTTLGEDHGPAPLVFISAIAGRPPVLAVDDMRMIAVSAHRPASIFLIRRAGGPTGDIIHHAALALISSSLFTEPHTPASAHETWTRARIAQNGRARVFFPAR